MINNLQATFNSKVLSKKNNGFVHKNKYRYSQEEEPKRFCLKKAVSLLNLNWFHSSIKVPFLPHGTMELGGAGGATQHHHH